MPTHFFKFTITALRIILLNKIALFLYRFFEVDKVYEVDIRPLGEWKKVDEVDKVYEVDIHSIS